MPQLIGSICADKLMSSSIETSLTNFALGIIVSCDRVFEVWTLWVESGLGLPLDPKNFHLEICDFLFGHMHGVLNIIK